MHHKRVRATGSPHKEIPCSILDCVNPHYGKGLCQPHYAKQRVQSRPCSAPDCANPTKTTYCTTHYRRLDKYGSLDLPEKVVVLCAIEDCSTPAKCKGWCMYHYRKSYEPAIEYRKAYYLANPERKAADWRKRRALQLAAPTERYTVELVLATHGTDCHLCGEPVDLDAPRRAGSGDGWERGLHIEHKIALSKGGTDLLSNVYPSHGLCNLRKAAN